MDKKEEIDKKYQKLFKELKAEEEDEINMKTAKIVARNKKSAGQYLEMLTNVKDYYGETQRLMHEQRIFEVEQLLSDFKDILI